MTDTERIDWLVENEAFVAYGFGVYHVRKHLGEDEFERLGPERDEPSEAIDAAMLNLQR